MRILGAILVLAMGPNDCGTSKKVAGDPAGSAAAPTPGDAAVAVTGNHAARQDFIDAARKHPELPFRLSYGRSDTELLVELPDPLDVCAKEEMDKLVEILGFGADRLRAAGFKRVACKDQQAFVSLGRARGGSRAERQVFIDEAAKNPDLGFAFSFGKVDTDLMMELTPAPGEPGADMPCSKEVLMKFLESARPLDEKLRFAGYKRLVCKGPWLTIQI